jgi:tripartite-type tricarboxylate transporter receptor subunit TctC
MKMQALLLAASMLVSPLAAAQAWPSKPLRLITPYPAGSGTDTLLRAMGNEMNKTWGQSVVVDNRPGASTMIAAETCAKAPADGYTFCMLDRSLSTLPHLYRKLPFDPDRDFTPITLLANLIAALAVSPNVPANSVKELIAYARANPGKLNYSTPGEGTPPHLEMEWIKQKFDLNIVHVPFKSPPEIVRTLVAGDIQVTIFGLINMLGPIRAGKAKALALSSRSPLLPDVPSMTETGTQPPNNQQTWFALYGPAALPRDIVDRVNRETVRMFAQPDFRRDRLLGQGWEPKASSAEELARFMKADRAAAAELVRMSGAKVQD